MAVNPQALAAAEVLMKSELAECEDIGIRQQARHLAALILQTVEPFYSPPPGPSMSPGSTRAMTLEWKVDPEARAAYAKVEGSPGTVARTIPAGPAVNFDVDWTGRVIGIEVLGALTDWREALTELMLRGEVRLVHGFEEW